MKFILIPIIILMIINKLQNLRSLYAHIEVKLSVNYFNEFRLIISLHFSAAISPLPRI